MSFTAQPDSDEWVEAYLALDALQTRYCHDLSAGRTADIAELFIDRDDVEIEINTRGVFRGLGAAQRMFPARLFADRVSPGLFGVHLAVNPLIEIDLAAGRSRGMWLSPGMHTVAYAPEEDPVSVWQYGRYFCEAVRTEDGQWRMLTLRWRLSFHGTGTWQNDWADNFLERPPLPPPVDARDVPHAPFRPTEVVSQLPGPPEPFERRTT